MQSAEICGKLNVTVRADGYPICPHCRRVVHGVRVSAETECKALRIYCRQCKQVFELHIDKGQCLQGPC